MPFTSQDSLWVLQGPLADRPLATDPGMVPGVSYYATDVDVEFEIVGSAWKAVSGAASLPIPATEIVIGTGAGVTSDPHFVWNPASAVLDVYDMAGIRLFSTDGTAGARSATFLDAVQIAMVEIGSKADATRKFDLLDDNATVMLHVSLWGPTRTVTILDESSEGIVQVNARTTTRSFSVLFPTTSFAAFSVNTRPATAGVTCNDVADNMVLYIDLRVASRHVEFGAPAQFQSVLFSALPVVGVDGRVLYVSNGCKVAELPGPGGGTGVMVYWSAGAWRTYSQDVPVVGV